MCHQRDGIGADQDAGRLAKDRDREIIGIGIGQRAAGKGSRQRSDIVVRVFEGRVTGADDAQFVGDDRAGLGQVTADADRQPALGVGAVDDQGILVVDRRIAGRNDLDDTEGVRVVVEHDIVAARRQRHLAGRGPCAADLGNIIILDYGQVVTAEDQVTEDIAGPVEHDVMAVTRRQRDIDLREIPGRGLGDVVVLDDGDCTGVRDREITEHIVIVVQQDDVTTRVQRGGTGGGPWRGLTYAMRDMGIADADRARLAAVVILGHVDELEFIGVRQRDRLVVRGRDV